MSQIPQYSSSEIAAYGAMQASARTIPTSVRVTCILSMIFSAFTVFGHLVTLVKSANVPAHGTQFGPAMAHYEMINSVVFGLFAVVAFTASLKCLGRSDLARQVLIGYAMAYIVATVFSIAMMILYVVPEIMEPVMGPMPSGSPQLVAVYVVAIFQGAMCLPVPVLILIFFNRPAALAAFAPATIG